MTAHPGTDDGLEVRVTGGVVRGVRERGMLAWRGMPYAAPPIGARRFRAPAPVLPWFGVRDASAYGAVAPQANVIRLARPTMSVLMADEDCLSVNVHAPVREAGESHLPVMVFIHGGGYSAGSSRDFSGQGEGFVRSGRVVYVSFNYRLGALGYLDFTRYSSEVARSRATSDCATRSRCSDGCGTTSPPSVGMPRASRSSARRRRQCGHDADDDAVGSRTLRQGHRAEPAARRGLLRELTARWAASMSRSCARSCARKQSERRGILRYALRRRAGISCGRGRRAGKRHTRMRRWRMCERSRGTGCRAPPRCATPRAPPTPQRLLTEASADDLVAASVVLQVRTPDVYIGAFCFAPVVDGDVVPERPFVAFRDGRAHRVPLIIGTNDREGTIFRGRVDILPRTPKRIDDLFARAPGAFAAGHAGRVSRASGTAGRDGLRR